MDRLPAIFVGIGALAGVIVAARSVMSRQRRAARATAERLGLVVRDAIRPAPLSDDRGRTWNLKDVECVEYLLPAPGASLGSWQFLMRVGQGSPDLPPGWRLESKNESVGPGLKRALHAVASDEMLQEEFFEFEGREHSVSVFWEEWGGRSMAKLLHGHLSALVEAQRTAS